MADDNKEVTNPVESLSAEDQVQYHAITAAFADDPDSIPEKFHNSEDPALSFLESYKQLERKLHSNGDDTETDTDTNEEASSVSGEESADSGTEIESLGFEREQGGEEGMPSLREIGINCVRNGGKVKPHDRELLKTKYNMSDSDIDNMFEPMVKQQAQAEVAQALEVVGGADNYKDLNRWILDNKTDAELASINQALTTSHRDTVLRGLMAEAGIQTTTKKQNSQVRPSDRPAQPVAEGYKSQAELNADLAAPIMKDRWHPDHQKHARRIHERIMATKPGVLL